MRIQTKVFLFFFFLWIPPLFSEEAFVKRAVDGDTLLLADERRIRLIGVDTPELHESQKLDRDSARSKKDKKTIQALGKKAYLFTQSLVEGKPVRLEYDPTNIRNHHLDKYGRTLAYVYFYCAEEPPEYKQIWAHFPGKIPAWKPDWMLLNALIIQCGYGNVYTRFPYHLMEEFRQHEKDAREAQVGLWAPEE
ncbi:MAG: thermonuclease family protein [Candidatus Aureabacteria bacterium]|nr:thermonuclease family protein [Candidatus Auribacterota bacterium]